MEPLLWSWIVRYHFKLSETSIRVSENSNNPCNGVVLDEPIHVGFSSQLCRVAQERAEQCSKLNSMEGLEIEISIHEK